MVADIHVLAGNGEHWDIVMHFPVPDINNAVGVGYQYALVASGLGGTTAMTEGTAPGRITPIEKGKVEAGELYECPDVVSVDGCGQSNDGRQALLRARYAAAKASAIADLQAQLKFFGHTESEV